MIHDASGRKLAYGDAGRRAPRHLPPPANVPLKDPRNFKLIGKPLKRLDTPDKVNGKAQYGIDAHAAGREVRHPGGSPGVRRQGRPCRRQQGQSLPGVRQMVVLDDLVAVVGDHMWAAKKGLDCARHHLGRRRQRAMSIPR